LQTLKHSKGVTEPFGVTYGNVVNG
jgi:hypothetical protein